MREDINIGSLTWVQEGLSAQSEWLMDNFPADPLTTFFPQAETADEVMLACSLSTLVLWTRALQRDLEILLEEATRPLGEDTYYDVLARLHRCVAVDQLLILQGEMMRSMLLQPGADIRFHITVHNASSFQEYFLVGLLTLNVDRVLSRLEESSQREIESGLLQHLKEAMLRHQELFNIVQHQVSDLFLSLCDHHQATRTLHLNELVPGDLLSFLEHEHNDYLKNVSLNGAHPGNDEVFWGNIVLYALKIWFSALSSACQEAIYQLRVSIHVGEAEHLILRMATLMHFFTHMLRMPLEASSSYPNSENRMGLGFDWHHCLPDCLPDGGPERLDRLPDGVLPCDRSLLYMYVKQTLFSSSEEPRLGDDWFDRLLQGPAIDEHVSIPALAQALLELDRCERRWWCVAGPLCAPT